FHVTGVQTCALPIFADALVARLKTAYESLPVGDPREDGVLVGPLIDEAAAAGFETALAQAVEQGGEVIVGGGRVDRDGVYVRPELGRASWREGVGGA